MEHVRTRGQDGLICFPEASANFLPGEFKGFPGSCQEIHIPQPLRRHHRP